MRWTANLEGMITKISFHNDLRDIKLSRSRWKPVLIDQIPDEGVSCVSRFHWQCNVRREDLVEQLLATTLSMRSSTLTTYKDIHKIIFHIMYKLTDLHRLSTTVFKTVYNQISLMLWYLLITFFKKFSSFPFLGETKSYLEKRSILNTLSLKPRSRYKILC